ncbi:hypothetical protein FPV67DRAFT_1444393 [Lyophyllum atratum]|nr:hypothetical protein FPV67DRAFT_1444393 [Lyophyllum atratum]
MPSLAGLFGRKNKSSTKQRANSNETDSALSSPTTDYVTTDRSIPSSPNGRSTLHPDNARGAPTTSSVYPSLATSSSKLRLPFSRKKASAAASTTSVVTTFSASQDSHFGTPPRPSYLTPRNSTSAASDSDVDSRRLRPPPSKSAIFAAYGDPHSALSTRSLPSEHSPLTITTSNSSAPIPPPVPPKKPGFFHWSKSTPATPPQTTYHNPNISASPPQLSPTTPTSDLNASFNLKSFRHVAPPSTGPSTGPSPNASNLSLPPMIPRPRGASVASESSQRISVAAFREAQARRSTAGSPVPSNRAPSPGPLSQTYSSRSHQHQTSSAPAVPHKNQQQQHQKIHHKRLSGLANTSASDSDETESSDEEEVDSDVSPPRGGIITRKRTVTKRPATDSPTIKGRATKSEMGHGSFAHGGTRSAFNPGPRSQSSHILMAQYSGQSNGQQVEQVQEGSRSQSSLGFNLGSRPRASASTSALAPSAAAKRASIIATANAIPLPNANGKHHTRASSAHSISASVPIPAPEPIHSAHSRRPAAFSSTSHSDSDSDSDDAPLATLLPPRRPGSALSSTSNSSLRGGPGRPAPKPLIDINQLTNNRPKPAKGNSTDVDAFTPGATLLGRGMTTSPPPVSPVMTSVSPPTRFVSPPSSPTREAKHFVSPGSGPQQQQLRSSAGAPMRRDTSPGGEDGASQRRGRDGLGERLTRVVQLRAGSGSGSGSGSSIGSGSVMSGFSGGANGSQSPPMKATPAPAPKKTKSTPQPPAPTMNPSPPDDDLAALLGAGIHLIRRTGDSASEESESEKSESDSESEDDNDGYTKVKKEPEPIAPIPIKQRAPPPAFSVTSRPPMTRSPGEGGDRTSVASTLALQGVRQRSSTLVPSSSSSAASTPKTSGKPGILSSANVKRDGKTPTSVAPPAPVAPAPRQRSSTLLPNSISSSAVSPGIGKGTSVVAMPTRPFAAVRRDSPASSTGDSSSGRAPFTPKDGSDLGVGSGSGSGYTGATEGTSVSGGWSGGVSGLMVKGKHIKRRSVSFEEDFREVTKGSGKGGKEGETPGEGEERRRERRRSEAKAAIELGNVINGRGPVVDDDDDDLPINQTLGGGARMSTINPMMAMGGVGGVPMGFGQAMSPGWNGMNTNMPMNGMNMNMNMMGQNPGMLAPGQFMPQGADPNFVAAHQQAMMFAKQAYQMAVAQQAMAVAGDEWERGSNVGGFGGGGSVYGGGGGSVYGGASPSIVGSPYGISPMMNMGMGMGMQSPNNAWSTNSVVYPGPARSMYGGISGARSDYGGGGGAGGGQWNASKSSYGESFGPSSNRNSRVDAGQGRPVYGQRDSGYFPPVPPIPQQTSASSGRGGPTAPRSRTASQPASPSRAVRRAPPPSSWKPGV